MKLLRYEPAGATVIQSFDQAMQRLINTINDDVLITNREEVITFKDTRLLHPSLIDLTEEVRALYPNYCRLNDRTYAGDLITTAHFGEQSLQINLGSFPVMLRSSACHLRTLSNEQLMAVGEDPQDVFGYFIIGGSEYLVINQERQAVNRIITFVGKNDQLQTILNAQAPDGRKIQVEVSLMKNPDDFLSEGKRNTTGVKKNIIRGKLSSFREEVEVNVCTFFEALGSRNEETPNFFKNDLWIQAYILDWVDEEDRVQVEEYLAPTLEEYRGIRGDLTGVSEEQFLSQEEIPTNTIAYIARKLRLREQGIPEERLEEEVKRRLYYELFANMVDQDPIQKRLELLGLMVARFITVATGIRARKLRPSESMGVRDPRVLVLLGCDDREDYTNKMVDNPGLLISSLLSKAWARQLTEAVSVLNNSTNLLNDLKTTFTRHKVMADSLTTAIRSGDWGIRGGKVRKGITRILQRESIVGAIADIRGINAPIDRKSGDESLRANHLSYWGIICPTTTPEGKNCGLTKALAQGARFSVSHNPLPLWEFLMARSSFDRITEGSEEEQHLTALMFNGRLLGWCNYTRLKREFLEHRRGVNGSAHTIPSDVSLHLSLDGIAEVHSEEGRPVRPVLVVDFLSQELMVKRLGLYEADWYTLLTHGAVEYLDAMEQTNCLIAINPQDLGVAVRGIAPDQPEVYRAHRDPDASYIPQYTHVELDPALLFSYEANMAPFPQHNPGTRITYQSKMARKAVGVPSFVYRPVPATSVDPAITGRFSSSKVLAYPQKPMIYTNTQSILEEGLSQEQLSALANLPVHITDEEVEAIKARLKEATTTDITALGGQNAIVAILSGPEAWNEEDAMMVNKRFVDFGGFMSTTYKVDSYEIENPYLEKLGIPPNLSEEEQELFSAVDPNTGIARAGSVLRAGMAILAKYTEEAGVIRNTSIYLKEEDYLYKQSPLYLAQSSETIRRERLEGSMGSSSVSALATARQNQGKTNPTILSSSISNVPILDEVHIGKNGARNTMVKWKIRTTRRPQTGDKFSSRFSQKGVAGRIMEPVDMPWSDSGISPDIVVNPHGYPTRMTMGQMIESMTGKAGALLGSRLEGTAFHQVDQEALGRVLSAFGFNPMGTETLYDGITGLPMQAMVFMGVVYYQVLPQMVEEKRQARSRGNYHYLWRQPPEGKSRGGGGRFGEQERDALIAHGARDWLRDRLCVNSDLTRLAICETCGLQCISNRSSNPPIEHCELCGENRQVNIIEAPTSFRLLTALNAAQGIKMPVRTAPPPQGR